VTPRSPGDLFAAAGEGDRSAKARLLSLIERGGEPAREVGRLAAPQAGQAYTIGLTGAPGAGKSTLTSALITHLRSLGDEVAVLAVDPSSPFTGGAILGDRVRMQDHATDPGVFIRSMATRGHLGGMALAAPEAIRVLDAAGHDLVIVETVGVGQAEVEVAAATDTTVVVVSPGWGDAVQVAKAGILEIADVFVVNKADREGSEVAVRDLQQMLWMGPELPWTPPVVPTIATEGAGIDEVWAALESHRAHLASSGELERGRRDRLLHEVESLSLEKLRGRARELLTNDGSLATDLAERRTDPYRTAAILEERITTQGS
jgi:LAO/AO transport system kinase